MNSIYTHYWRLLQNGAECWGRREYSCIVIIAQKVIGYQTHEEWNQAGWRVCRICSYFRASLDKILRQSTKPRLHWPFGFNFVFVELIAYGVIIFSFNPASFVGDSAAQRWWWCRWEVLKGCVKVALLLWSEENWHSDNHIAVKWKRPISSGFTSVVKLLVEAKVEFQATETRRRVILLFNIFDLECEMRK